MEANNAVPTPESLNDLAQPDVDSSDANAVRGGMASAFIAGAAEGAASGTKGALPLRGDGKPTGAAAMPSSGAATKA